MNLLNPTFWLTGCCYKCKCLASKRVCKMQNLDGRKLEFNGEIVVDIFYR